MYKGIEKARPFLSFSNYKMRLNSVARKTRMMLDTTGDIYAGSLHDWFEPGDTAPSGAIHQPDSPCRQPRSSPLCSSLSLTTVAYTWPSHTGWPKLIVDFSDACPVAYCKLHLCMCAGPYLILLYFSLFSWSRCFRLWAWIGIRAFSIYTAAVNFQLTSFGVWKMSSAASLSFRTWWWLLVWKRLFFTVNGSSRE